MMDRETGLAYQQLLEARIPPNVSVSTDTFIELLRELLTGRKSLHVQRKLLFKSFWKRGKVKVIKDLQHIQPFIFPNKYLCRK